MKTAEEHVCNLAVSPNLTDDAIQTIREIQLDAMKEGMRRAAKIPYQSGITSPVDASDAILTAAEQLTEKDL